MSFQEVCGDLWELARGDVLVITTNGCINSRGECIMGRGIALQAKQRFPEVAKKLGGYIRQYGNRCFNLGRFGDYTLVSFPTKDDWRKPSSLELIIRSAGQLVEMANKFEWSVVYMPRPGCGNGRLSWQQVAPVLERILDERFYIAQGGRC
ncbi:hypothetical protein MTAT_20100 [Moorella thermoacetica]|uniref:Macro domain-containing protein n=1 Tax=Neomoorella thermoacetica TaxID=1525 RepID=A0AAC9HJ81_NEOTH|nr:hypothetical protein [Moorella thermoacetica]AOQ24665.1 hypothetical protein Maut_02237 [Moorella thermoacetica]TYL12768.1 hypothetical protein MTAT_20100 [Moorella thermoacetica]